MVPKAGSNKLVCQIKQPILKLRILSYYHFFLSISTLKQKSALARQIEKRANFVKKFGIRRFRN